MIQRPASRPASARLRTRPRLAAAAVLVVAAMTVSGCTALLPRPKPTPTDPFRTGSIAIAPLFVRGDSGGVGAETITRQKSDDGTFRLDFSEDEVGGLGEASRAASWNAAITSTLLMGEPLEGRYGFEISGAIDGPSAGALKTVALIALSRGDMLVKGVTMTGTINSTGTIGPVGGIPEKIRGAAEEEYTTVLIPLGQRNTPDANGDSVDVVREGDRLGVEVVEVGDVYEAYKLLTGTTLPAPNASGEPRLDNRSYDKVDAQVTAALGRFRSAQSEFRGASALVRESLETTDAIKNAEDSAEKAADLQRQGLVAGAFVEAQNAAALMETVAAGADAITPLETQGLAGVQTIVERASDTQPAEAAFQSFLDQLGTYEPETITDVEALVNAYAGAFDAYSLLDFAASSIASAGERLQTTDADTVNDAFADFILALLYLELSQAQIENSRAVFEVGRDNPSAAVKKGVDLQQVGDFFRRGADANYAAFTSSGVVKQIADARGLSIDVVVNGIAAYDLDVAVAAQQKAVLPGLERYIGEGSDNAAYANMAYGLSNYVRNQLLVEKYYNNAELNNQFQITGIQFEGALNHAIDLSRDQLANEIDTLRKRKAPPVIGVANYEAAGLIESGDPLQQFQALGGYEGGFVTSRLLSYIGGWVGGTTTATPAAEE